MIRFLSLAEKRYHLKVLRGHQSLPVDRNVWPMLNRLNVLPGVVTVQSCQGHKRKTYVNEAHVAVRLSRRVWFRALRSMGDILTVPEVEEVCIRPFCDEKPGLRGPWLNVIFQGCQRSRASYERGATAICRWLENAAGGKP